MTFCCFLLSYRLMRLRVFRVIIGKFRKNPLMSGTFFFFQKIIGSHTSDIQKIFCQLQIFFLSCHTVKLYKCQLNLLMSRIAVDLSFFRSECSADKICKLWYNIQEMFLSCCIIIGNCRLDHMSGCVKLMPLHQVTPTSVRFFYGKICIQIAIFLLCAADQINGLICQCFQLFITLIA